MSLFNEAQIIKTDDLISMMKLYPKCEEMANEFLSRFLDNDFGTAEDYGDIDNAWALENEEPLYGAYDTPLGIFIIEGSCIKKGTYDLIRMDIAIQEAS